MSVLTLFVGTADEMDAACQRGGFAPPTLVGGITRTYNGVPVSNIRAELQNTPVVLSYLDAAASRVIRAACAKGAQFVVNGEVLDNNLADMTVWAELTGEMLQGGVWWELSLTLHEVSNVDTATPTPAVVPFYLTNVDNGANKLATTDPAGDSNGTGNETLLDAETVATTPSITISSTAERTWLSPATTLGGWMTGAPTVQFLSGGGDGSEWALQDCMCKIYVVRSGSDVAEWDTDWSFGAGGFSGGTITMAAPAVVFKALPGDQIRVEVYGRGSLQSGHTATVLQTLTFGKSGPFHYGQLLINGGVLFQ